MQPVISLCSTVIVIIGLSLVAGYQAAKCCPGGSISRLAWAFILGNALFVIGLWNLSWLGFPVAVALWPLLLSLSALNLVIEGYLRWRPRAFPSLPGDDGPTIKCCLFLLPIVVAFAWQIIPLVMSQTLGAVIYSAPEFPTNTGLPEWFVTHGMRDDLAALPSDPSAWGAWRHLSMKLRVGQHLYHALLIVFSGQSVVATWPLMSAMTVAIQAVGAFLLSMYATRGRWGWATLVSVLIAAHPFLHSACHTTFISMAMGLAFLTAACTLVFATAEDDARLTLAIPLSVCVLAMALSYQEILPVFVITAGLFWIFSVWAVRRDRSRLYHLASVAIFAAFLTFALSPVGVWWSFLGLLRQTKNVAHGMSPVMVPEMILSLVTGLAQLPGTWKQLDCGLLATALRWGAIGFFAGGLAFQFSSKARRRAVVATLCSVALLFLLVFWRGGESDLLRYGLSRAILYHGCLLFIFSLSGWVVLVERHKTIAVVGIVIFCFSFASFIPRYFRNVFKGGSFTIPSVANAPAWLSKIPTNSFLLFETKDRDQVALEVPYWHWLHGRTAIDTFLEPTPLTSTNKKAAAFFSMPVGAYAIPENAKALPENLQEIAREKHWRIFRPLRPFVANVGTIHAEMGLSERFVAHLPRPDFGGGPQNASKNGPVASKLRGYSLPNALGIAYELPS